MYVKVPLSKFRESVKSGLIAGNPAHLGLDVTTENGLIIYPAGTAIETLPKSLAQLAQGSHGAPADTQAIAPQDVVDHEGNLYIVPPQVLAPSPNDKMSVWSDNMSRRCLSVLGRFWEGLHHGLPPDVASIDLMHEALVGELLTQPDQLKTLTQLRLRDSYTWSHTLDVTVFSLALAIRLELPYRQVMDIGLAALLHDLGKYRIPRPIMFKAGRLTEHEFAVMKLHPEFGYSMIVDELGLEEAIGRPALEHQEMYGGGGYPHNIAGSQIHPYSHVVKIADVYDALTSERPYKKPIESHTAIRIMKGEGTKSFHPEMLDCFVTMANYVETDEKQDRPAGDSGRTC